MKRHSSNTMYMGRELHEEKRAKQWSGLGTRLNRGNSTTHW